MVKQTQSHSVRSQHSARLGAFALCLLTCSLTGCVANWSVLGERIPGGNHPADAACPTCAAPQTAVVPPVTTQPPAVPPAPIAAQPPQNPVATAETKLADCEGRVWQLEEMIRAREESLKKKELDDQAVMNGLLLQMQAMQAAQEARAKKDMDQFKALNDLLLKKLEEDPEAGAQAVAPSPLRTPPAPQGSQAVNELRALPPANGSL